MAMKIDFIKGIITPILTIIDDNELIDEKRMRRHINHIINGGVHGILAFGSNGEFYMVDDDEMERGLKIILDETAGRVPVYFGIGSIKTKRSISLAQMAQEEGANGISVLQPMFLKPTEEELYGYFKEIADSVPELPILLYNNPGRVGYSLSTQLVERLADDTENIIGIKDSSGDIGLTIEFIRIMRDRNFKIFGGKDTLIYATMTHGAHGAVATTSNFLPQLVSSIYDKFISGDGTFADLLGKTEAGAGDSIAIECAVPHNKLPTLTCHTPQVAWRESSGLTGCDLAGFYDGMAVTKIPVFRRSDFKCCCSRC